MAGKARQQEQEASCPHYTPHIAGLVEAQELPGVYSPPIKYSSVFKNCIFLLILQEFLTMCNDNIHSNFSQIWPLPLAPPH